MQRNHVTVFAALILSFPAFGALPATTVWEVRPSVGSDSNGGCFDSAKAGTDFSQQNANQYTFSDLASANGTTNPSVVTSASHNFVAADVGNCIHISAGTNWTTGWYECVSAAANACTLDRAAGSVAALSGGTYFVGGALLTLTQLNTNMVQGNIAWMKATATVSVAGGTININYTSAGTGGVTTQINGYTTARGDNGVVTLQATASANPIISIQNSVGGLSFRNFVLDCNSQTTSFGLSIQGTQGASHAENILVKNCNAGGVKFNNFGHACIRCTVTASSGGTAMFLMEQGNGSNYCLDCLAVSNTNVGFSGGRFQCTRCIAANNTGASSDGFSLTNAGTGDGPQITNSVSYKNGRDGIRIAAITSPPEIENSVFYGNTGVGINSTTLIPSGGYTLNWNAVGSNTGGNRTNVSAGANDVTLTADPFTNGAGNVFALNATAGGGAALNGSGFPGVLANGGTSTGGTGFESIGTLQPSGTPAANPVGVAFTQ